MAQWNGQYSGNSHSTKVDDFEYMLRHAVAVSNQATSEELRHDKAKAVRKLAAKVLNARLKLIKAKRYEAEPFKSEEWSSKRTQIEHLTEKKTLYQSECVNGILREFSAKELITDESN